MRFLNWLKRTPLWLAVFPIAVALVLWAAVSGYEPLTFDPSLYEVEQAHAADLATIDAAKLEEQREAEQEASAEAAAAAAASATAALSQTGLTDGTYTGYAVCGAGNPDGWKPYYVAVTIRVKDGKVATITDISGTSTSRSGGALSWDPSENQSYLDQALYGGWGVKSQMESQLSSAGSVSGVDTVSGATYSSVAVYNAYMDAVAQAGGSSSAAKEVKDKDGKDGGKDSKTVKTDDDVKEKTLANGAWTGYAVCGEGNDQDWKPYYVAVTIKVKNGKVVPSFKVKGTSKGEKGKAKLNWDKAENGVYLDWAAKGRVRGGVEYAGVVPQIKDVLAKGEYPQSIDTVSGATYSSEAIFEALYAALKKSAKAGGATVKDPKKEKPADEPVDDPTEDPSGDDGGDPDEPVNPADPDEPTGPDDPTEPDEPTEVMVDGVYMGHAFCQDLDDPKAYSPYYIIVKITVTGGKITEITDVYGDDSGEIDPRYRYDSSENATYLKFAINGVGKRVKGMKAKIQEKLDAGAAVEGLDTVSSATWSSLAILDAYQDAVSNIATVDLDLTVGP